MTFDPARPRYTLPFAGKDYDLLGTMGLIEAVEFALKRGIGDITVGVVNGMPSFELAKLLEAVLTASDHKVAREKVGDLLWNEVGLSGEENTRLRFHLYAFLTICLAPPGERSKKADEMGEVLGKLEKRASPGRTTRKPVSAASAGSLQSSGEQPPGT